MGLHISKREQNFDVQEYQQSYYKSRTLLKRRAAGIKPIRSTAAPSKDLVDAIRDLACNFTWDDLALHFWTRVTICDNGCWEWQGGKTRHGYGRATIGDKNVYAHRFAYEMVFGPLNELWACHHCDNPRCVNPSHIYAGTPKDNALDRERRGRRRKG